MSNQSNKKVKNRFVKIIEKIIFATRWLLIPFYLILICALAIYMIVDVKEFIHYAEHFKLLSKEGATLTLIEMIDLAMIAALCKMIVTGGYNSFISKDHGYPDENVGSGLLKVKMATSLIGVTSIALLAKSINISVLNPDVTPISWDELYKLGFIHGLFLFGAIVLSYVDHLHLKTEMELEANHLRGKNLENGVQNTKNNTL